MDNKQKQNFILPNLKLDKVTTFCTQRNFSNAEIQGHSKAPFNNFNLAEHVGDSFDDVHQNRAILHSFCGSTCVYLNQTHSNKIIAIKSSSQVQSDADASFTREKNLPLAILTADCVPLVITNDDDIVCVIHAGWRGLLTGIIENSVSTLRQNTSKHNFFVWIAPCIHKNNFEVGKDVYDLFINANQSYKQYFQPKNNAKFLADLVAIATDKLITEGVARENIYASEICTYQSTASFFSYRREGMTGRFATVAMLK